MSGHLGDDPLINLSYEELRYILRWAIERGPGTGGPRIVLIGAGQECHRELRAAVPVRGDRSHAADAAAEDRVRRDGPGGHARPCASEGDAARDEGEGGLGPAMA